MGIGAILSFLNSPNIRKNDLSELLTSKPIAQTKLHTPQRIPYDTWQEARIDIDTPEEVAKFEQTYMQYLSDAENYGYSDYHDSFERMFKNRIIDEKGNEFITGDCFNYALIAAGLLSDDGYGAQLIGLSKLQNTLNLNWYIPQINMFVHQEIINEKNVGHSMFIYQSNNQWNAINVGQLSRNNYSSPENVAKGFSWGKFVTLNLDEIYRDWLTHHGDMTNLELRNNELSFVREYKTPDIIQQSGPRSESATLAITIKKQKDYMKEIIKSLMNEEPCILPIVYRI